MKYRVLPVLLAVLVSSLTPLAHATPPDPTWLPGFYDDADYDNVVLLVLSGLGAVAPAARRGAEPPLVVVAPASPVDESLRSLRRPTSSPPRAPPIA